MAMNEIYILFAWSFLMTGALGWQMRRKAN